MTTKIYRYHIVDRNDKIIEANIPDEEQAETYLRFLQERDGYATDELHITKEHVPQLHGHRLGRDPDLH